VRAAPPPSDPLTTVCRSMIVTTVLLVLFAAGLAVAGVRVLRILRTELDALRSESARQLADRNADVDRRLEAMTATMDRRLETATKTTSAIHLQLGQLGQANAEILARANDLKKLEQALRPPKARGGFGELLLGNLLSDRLPADAYELQYGFNTGERVDAVIKVERLVPIDAKFPLDNFERLADAESDDERALYEKAFSRDLRNHVDAIANKYIRPDEGTYDFALMYLPSEGVYYELVCGKTGALLQYAHDKRVFPVSPTTFTSQLQVIVLGLKGMQIEQRAHEVMAYVAQLQGDFDRFRDDFQVVGKHIGNAQSKFAEAEKRLDRFDTKLERAAETDPVEVSAAQELPRALDAA
jgi:DNA recombination protein RmuC